MAGESDYRGDQHAVEELPRPTAAPPAMAMGIMLLTWGIMTHWSMSIGGLALMGTALCLWIKEISRDWGES